MMLLLNFWDETDHEGISIDYNKIEDILDLPIIPTCAISGKGIKEFVERIPDARQIN